VTNGARVRERWRAALRHIGSGPLLGWVYLAAMLFGVAVWGIATGDLGWYLSIPAPWLAAAGLNACIWLAAIMIGRTQQLRSSWFAVVAMLLALAAAMELWPTWGRDMAKVIGYSMIALGFPTDAILLVAFRDPHPWLDRADIVILPLSFFGLAYLQAFILLPRLFKWRARPTAGVPSQL
jgi:hypothetical protein